MIVLLYFDIVVVYGGCFDFVGFGVYVLLIDFFMMNFLLDIEWGGDFYEVMVMGGCFFVDGSMVYVWLWNLMVVCFEEVFVELEYVQVVVVFVFGMVVMIVVIFVYIGVIGVWYVVVVCLFYGGIDYLFGLGLFGVEMMYCYFDEVVLLLCLDIGLVVVEMLVNLIFDIVDIVDIV